MEKMGIAGSVDEFEKVFEDMEVKTGEVDMILDNQYQGTMD